MFPPFPLWIKGGNFLTAPRLSPWPEAGSWQHLGFWIIWNNDPPSAAIVRVIVTNSQAELGSCTHIQLVRYLHSAKLISAESQILPSNLRVDKCGHWTLNTTNNDVLEYYDSHRAELGSRAVLLKDKMRVMFNVWSSDYPGGTQQHTVAMFVGTILTYCPANVLSNNQPSLLLAHPGFALKISLPWILGSASLLLLYFHLICWGAGTATGHPTTSHNIW